MVTRSASDPANAQLEARKSTQSQQGSSGATIGRENSSDRPDGLNSARVISAELDQCEDVASSQKDFMFTENSMSDVAHVRNAHGVRIANPESHGNRGTSDGWKGSWHWNGMAHVRPKGNVWILCGLTIILA